MTAHSGASPAVATAPARATAGKRRQRRRETALFWALILPNLTAILVFSYYPTAYNFVLSFTDWDFLQPRPEFVGLQNYRELFQPGSTFGTALANTGLLVLIAVVGTLAGGLAIGWLLAQKLHLSGFVRTITFTPYMLPGAATGILWLFIFDPNYGLNRWLLGLDAPRWVTTSDYSLWAVIIAYTWQRLGFVAIIYYTAITNLPSDIYEAAELDGARGWRLMRSMTLPLLSPVTFFLTVTGILAASQTFDLIATLTSGGPGDSSTTLPWMIYTQAFREFNIGSSAATATVLFVLLIIVTAIQARFTGRRVHYS